MNKPYSMTSFVSGALALMFLFSIAATAEIDTELSKKWDTWLNETVVYIISEREREVFLLLKSEEQRQQFEAAFWLERDPTSGTERNEFRDEHFERLAYANKFYGRDTFKPGWRTDRGKMHILLGKPKTIDRYPSHNSIYPLELWMFQAERGIGLPNFFYLIFFRPNMVGELILYQPGRHLPSHLVAGSTIGENVFEVLNGVSPELSRASAGLVADEPPSYDPMQPNMSSVQLLARIENVKNRMVDPQYADSILVGAGEVTTQFAFIDADITHTISPFVDNDGTAYIDYAFLLPADSLEVGQYRDTIYGAWEVETLLADGTGTTVVQMQNEAELEMPQDQFAGIRNRPFRYENRIACTPGEYTLTIRIKNKVSRRMAVITEAVNVTSKPEATIDAGPLLITQNFVAFQSAGDATFRPFEYVLGRLYSDPRNLIPAGSQQPAAYCQLYKDENVQGNLDVTFAMSSPEGEVIGSANVAVPSNTFSSAGTYNLFIPLPLQGLTQGNFNVKLTVADGQEQIERNASFEIYSAQPVPPLPLDLKQGSKGRAERLAEFAEQLVGQNAVSFALHKYGQALAIAPEDTGVRQNYAQLLLEIGEYMQAVELLRPLLISAPNEIVYLKLAARAHLGADQPRNASKLLERTRFMKTIDVEGLNLLAEAYVRMGDTEKARVCLTESLLLNPDQLDVKQQMESLQ